MTKYKKVGVLIFLTVFSFFTLVDFSSAKTVKPTPTPKPKHQLLSVFYYRDSKKAFASFVKNVKKINVIAPQWYTFNQDGVLRGIVDADLINIAGANGVKVMPLITNGNFSAAVMEAILSDPTKQDKIIAQIITEAQKYNYWGWQFDLEQISADNRDKFSAFVARAGQALKQNNLKFSVAVIAQISANPADYKNDLWNKIIGVYDYRAIASNTDFVSVMSYDQPDSKGPVASLPWFKKVVAYSLTQIPSEKLSIGIPFYYWKWDTARGKLVDIGSYSRVANLAASGEYTSKGFSEAYQVPWIKYKQGGKKYITWYENVFSFQKKLEVATANNLHGFSAWVLGLEDPRIFDVLKKQPKSL
ncbi:MAG: glycosyl hydrolase family 18 protein [Patescibacteria group bacterium]